MQFSPLAIAVLLCTLAGPAHAEVFRWTDAQGRLHFAQSLDQVPVAHRKQAAAGSSRGGSFQTFAAEPASAVAPTSASRTLRIPFRRESSLMRVAATINGHLDVPFYFDTGASGVSIPAGYAKRLGIQIGPDTQFIAVRTANGVISVPYVRLDSVQLGGARVEGLMATINPTMNIGLLGGSFFNQFNYRVDTSANVITLQRNYAAQTDGPDEHYWRRRFQDVRGPLAELEKYLRERDITRKGRRAELEQKRQDLRAKLKELEIEANRDDVPAAWRR
jgi:clan AA aspartic protease (TIGR02281 family)